MKYLLFLIVSFVSCLNDKKIDSVRIENQLFQKIISRYEDYADGLSKNALPITVNCKRRLDTTIFDIVKGFPELEKTTFFAYNTSNNYRVCFIGTYPSEGFLNFEKKIKIPKDIIEKNKQLQDGKIKDMQYTEPILWTFYFKGNKLIDFVPKDEIQKACPECKIDQ